METIFALSNLTVMPFWALMILLPTWGITRRVMGSPLVAALPALIYAALVLPQIGPLFATVSRPELPEIAALLGTPEGAMIGWAHFLAFDLLAGRWAYLDSRERGVSPWLMAPVLFLVLMLGPLGFLLYLGVRVLDLGYWRSGRGKPITSANEKTSF
jgi:apolipoprotein N-acyltransferase